MIGYTTITRQTPYTNGLNPLALLNQAQDVYANQTRLTFSQRKPITRVPMGFCLNGPSNVCLGQGIYTDQLADCEAILVLGYDPQGGLRQVGFSHVLSGDPQYLNWGHLMYGMNHCARVIACIATSWSRPQNCQLYQHARANGLIADHNILVYCYGDAHSRGGKTFGVNGLQQIGEPDVTALIERNTARQLNQALSHYMVHNQHPSPIPSHCAMKIAR